MQVLYIIFLTDCQQVSSNDHHHKRQSITDRFLRSAKSCSSACARLLHQTLSFNSRTNSSGWFCKIFSDLSILIIYNFFLTAKAISAILSNDLKKAISRHRPVLNLYAYAIYTTITTFLERLSV